jgi:uncharacterized protein (TIGR02594 family)
MQNPAPIWLDTMRGLDGTHWAQGDGPNPKIQDLLRTIGAAFPPMNGYCNSVMNEDYFSWCGLTVGYCMTKAGIAPVFGNSGDTSRFLYAAAWLGWGTPVTTPQLGDVLVFDFGGGDHHVTLFEKDNGDGTYGCHGGNQSHEVNTVNFRKSRLMGIRRPSAGVGELPVAADTLAPGAVGRAVTALQSALAAKNFDPGGIDGEYGPLTSAAVSSFQRSQNLSVTGIADPITLRALGLSLDVGPTQADGTMQEPTMQLLDLFKTVLDALITKQLPPAIPVQPPATTGQAPVDIGQLLQIAIAALTGKPLPLQLQAGTAAGTSAGSAAGTTTPPVLSTIDRLLGGQALAGKKTILAVIAYVILAVLEGTNAVTPGTGTDIAKTLIEAFGALGGLAKVDRLTQMLGQVAGQATSQK